MKNLMITVWLLLCACCWGVAQSSICSKAIDIQCGQTIRSNNFSSGNTLVHADYDNCLADVPVSQGPFDGNDVVYRLRFESPQTVDILLTDLNADLDLFIFVGCGATSKDCQASSKRSNTQDEGFRVNFSAGTFYIVIDGFNTAQRSSFTLQLGCGDGGGEEDPCEDALPLSCDTPLSGNNFSGGSDFGRDFYGNCVTSSSSFNANDRVYAFEVPDFIRTVEVRLTRLQADLDLFVYQNVCRAGQCVARSTNSGNSNEILRLTNVSGTLYFIVDGFNASQQSSFIIEVICIDPCEAIETEDLDCDLLSFNYSGENDEITYDFSIPNNIPSGQWTAKKGNSTIPIGIGRNISYTFNIEGIWEVCYFYNNSDGCQIKCCKTIYLENPYNCNDITYSYDDNANRYELTISGITSENVLEWRDDDNNAIIGRNSTVTVPINEVCSTRRFSVTFFDPAVGYYRVCCIALYICDPYDCDRITATENANSFTLTLPGIAAADVTRWLNDDTGAVVANASNTISVPKPLPGECANYSVQFFDIATNSFRLCCIQVCTPACEGEPIDNDCDELDFNYIGLVGNSRYQFTVPNSLPSGTWTAQFQGSTFGIGSGRLVNYTFTRAGNYTICYQYTDADGCDYQCCKTIFVSNPYDCDQIFYDYNRTTQRYQLTLPGIAPANIIRWMDDDNNAVIGSGTSVTIPIGETCVTRQFSVLFFDPAVGAYRICCISIFICDPLDCNNLIATPNNNGFRLNIAGVTAGNVLRWVNEDTGATVGGNTTTINVPTPGFEQCVTYSVFFFDPGTNSYRVCCIEVCNPCSANDIETDCDELDFRYVGIAGQLRYRFNVPSAFANGSWTAEFLGSRFDIGSGNEIVYTFTRAGTYTVCFTYTDANGCEKTCCKTIQVDNPYDCTDIAYRVDATNNRYVLTLPNIPAQNIVRWIDDDTGTILGGGTSINVPITAICTTRRFSVLFFDPASQVYRICCIAIYICDPYDCDRITAVDNGGTFTLSIPGISASSVLRWQNDETLATVGAAVSTITVPKPAGGECDYYSVFFFDPATQSYRVCCIELCNDCQDDLDCELLEFNYAGENGALRYTFNVPVGTPVGTWTITGGIFGSNEITLATASSIAYTFPATGTYTVCYTFTDEEGCTYQCCRTVCITGDPYDCDKIVQTYDPDRDSWILSLPGVADSDVAFWQNDVTLEQFNQGEASAEVPNPASGSCAFYSVILRDPDCGGYIICCVRICNEGCGAIDNIDLTCEEEDQLYNLQFDLINNSGKANLTAEFTMLSPIGVTFQGCTNLLNIPNINANQTLGISLEGCLVPLTPGTAVTFKVTLREPGSTWCCHLEPITVTIPECDNCFTDPQPDLNCVDVFDPVCGCDSMTYSNDCYALRAGVAKWTPGVCCFECPEDPLAEFTWLSDLADELETCCDGGNKEIRQCKLDGKCVYVVPDCALADGFTTLYDCNGNIICQEGGIAGLTCDEFDLLTDCEVIWTCGADACTPACVGRNLVLNGDFESGYFGFGSDLSINCTCANATYCVSTNARNKCNNSLWQSVTSTGRFLIVDGSRNFPYDVWRQGNINVVAGNTYSFTFDFFSSISGAASPTLQLWAGNTLIADNITGTVGSWETINFNWTATTTANLTISIRHTNSAGFDDFGIDNIKFTECRPPTGDPLQDLAWLLPFVGDPNYSISRCDWDGTEVYVLQDFCLRSDGIISYYDCNGNIICEAFQTGTTCDGNFNVGSCVTLQDCNVPNAAMLEERTAAASITLDNYPNPFTGSTNILFELPSADDAVLVIYDANGKEVYRRAAYYEAGQHQIEFNTNSATDAGVYYYRLETSTATITKTMILMEQSMVIPQKETQRVSCTLCVFYIVFERLEYMPLEIYLFEKYSDDWLFC